MEKWMRRSAWVEVDLNNLDNNIKIVLSKVTPGCRVLGTVKANAYGCGMKECYKIMKENGIDIYGVATLDEALELRSYCAPEDDILMFGTCPDMNVDEVVENNIITHISRIEYAKALSEEAVKQGKTAKVMGCVDTGMGRIGYQWDDPETIEELYAASKMPGLEMIGIFSHLATADSGSREYCDVQKASFEYVIDRLGEKGLVMPYNALTNSPGTMFMPDMHYGMCRPGAVFYGGYQRSVVETEGIKNVISVKADVMQIKDVPAGFSVSYSRTFKTDRPSRIATIGLGFADGMPRNWGWGAGRVIVGHSYAPIVGTLCMDQFMIDITDITDVKVGDECIIMGEDGDLAIYADDIIANTSHLFTTLWTALPLRLPYKYIR